MRWVCLTETHPTSKLYLVRVYYGDVVIQRASRSASQASSFKSQMLHGNSIYSAEDDVTAGVSAARARDEGRGPQTVSMRPNAVPGVGTRAVFGCRVGREGRSRVNGEYILRSTPMREPLLNY